MSCDNRPQGVYEREFVKPVNAKVIEHNGIRYLFMSINNADRRGWVVDYSQFFEGDTLFIHDAVWVRVGNVEDFKPTRIPTIEE